MYLTLCSGGNDSVALLQFMINQKLGFSVVYNDTGWARDDWQARIDMIKTMLPKNVTFYTTESEGLEALVRRKKGWPMPASKMQFCTQALKEGPTLELMKRIDPKSELIIVTGRRRAESQNRRAMAVYEDESPKHGGRDVYNPMAMMLEPERDVLIRQFGLEPLPHQSMECYPCVCANKTDLGAIKKDDPVINRIEAIEIDMGHTRNEKPRTMFRPYRVGGGVGIRQAIEWGHGARGFKSDYTPNEYKLKGAQTSLFEGVSDIAYEEDTEEGKAFARQCEGGYCGS